MLELPNILNPFDAVANWNVKAVLHGIIYSHIIDMPLYMYIPSYQTPKFLEPTFVPRDHLQV